MADLKIPHTLTQQTMQQTIVQQTVYVQGVNHCISQPLEDKTLRAELKKQGVEARRLSRFTQLALLGALPLKEKIQPDTALYLGSSFSSPSKFNKMFQQLTEQHLPSPLDFMANLNNAATFQLAQTLGSNAPTLFLAVNKQQYWQPLHLALTDLSLSPTQTVLVGWAFEHYAKHQQEGSIWVLLSTKAENAIGTLSFPPQSSHSHPKNEMDCADFLQPLHNIIKLV